jgi:hypothetical protein
VNEPTFGVPALPGTHEYVVARVRFRLLPAGCSELLLETLRYSVRVVPVETFRRVKSEASRLSARRACVLAPKDPNARSRMQ